MYLPYRLKIEWLLLFPLTTLLRLPHCVFLLLATVPVLQAVQYPDPSELIMFVSHWVQTSISSLLYSPASQESEVVFRIILSYLYCKLFSIEFLYGLRSITPVRDCDFLRMRIVLTLLRYYTILHKL